MLKKTPPVFRRRFFLVKNAKQFLLVLLNVIHNKI
jgi:hypothetical protein